jgi:prephenate dehydrogenase
MKKAAIIGFGRFGQLLADLMKDVFEISVVEPDMTKGELATARGFKLMPLSSLGDADFVFLAVPISAVEGIIKDIAPLVAEHQTVVDGCSVKVYPANLMKKHLQHCQTIASHPLFGPDSAGKGLHGLKMVLCRLNVSDENFDLWRDFWVSKELEVIESTPEEHDKDSVYSQAFTYSIARIILAMKIPDLRFTTRSFNAIKEVAALSANDSDELFHDMLHYNPYFPEMKVRLEKAISTTLDRLKTIENEPMPEY